MSKNTKNVSTIVAPSDVIPTTEVPTIAFALNLKQAAQYSSMSVWALRSAIWAGNLPARLGGKRLLILRTDLETFVTKSLPRVRSGKRISARPPVRRKKAA